MNVPQSAHNIYLKIISCDAKCWAVVIFSILVPSIYLSCLAAPIPTHTIFGFSLYTSSFFPSLIKRWIRIRSRKSYTWLLHSISFIKLTQLLDGVLCVSFIQWSYLLLLFCAGKNRFFAFFFHSFDVWLLSNIFSYLHETNTHPLLYRFDCLTAHTQLRENNNNFFFSPRE